MWILFVVIIGLAHPIQIDGYRTKTECDIAAADALVKLAAVNPVPWCTKDPWKEF